MQKDVLEKIVQLMTAAFGLVAALAWNEAIQGLFRPGAPLGFLATSGPWAYAIIITIIAVIATIWIGRAAAKAK